MVQQGAGLDGSCGGEIGGNIEDVDYGAGVGIHTQDEILFGRYVGMRRGYLLLKQGMQHRARSAPTTVAERWPAIRTIKHNDAIGCWSCYMH
jgi:hypothetical protein